MLVGLVKKGSLSSARLARSRPSLVPLPKSHFIRADAKSRLYKRDHANKEEIMKVMSQKRQTDRQTAVWKETRKAINGFESQYVFCLV